ncbi:RHS repeat protein [Motiliproteus coralliicola]|uniref:RHS repeat protein n=1 Tax=Motiliproteus coralliicola TaxID=2283196 RepID=A0A369WL52_9GAMM|nr:RHS repeat-associated core domain-containing protein [Motiliproteus coralliicola]RDE22357.1 RHS repeat protein [Motiliproteus coralliicola]
MNGCVFNRTAVLLLSLLFSVQVWAVGGVTTDNARPYFATGKLNETFTDLRVKVLGGYVRVTRYWEDGRWVWNRRWSDLEPAWGTTEDLHPSSFRRIDQHYPQVVGGEAIRYENQLTYTIDYRDAEDEYRWQDRRGNQIDYAIERDDNGRILRVPMLRYRDRNGVTVSVERDSDGNITTVRDHHGTPVLTYHWEPATTGGGQRLAKVSDYSGREVQYQYDSEDRLTGVIDPRGETYRYDYATDGQLARFIDPKDQAIQYQFKPASESVIARVEVGDTVCEYTQIRGSELTSRINADGVGDSYAVSYNKETRQFTTTGTDATGVVREWRYDEHGQLVSYSLGGNRQYSTQIVLSDNSLGVDSLVAQYQPSYGITVVDIERDGVAGKHCWTTDSSTVRSQLGGNDLIYVKQRTRTDQLGRKTVTEYDQFKNPIKVTYPDGSTRTRSYDTQLSLLLSETGPRGFTTTYEYDANGNLLTLTEAMGSSEQRITRYEYDPYGQRIKQTTGESSAGNTELAVTQWQYDAYGNVIQTTDPLNHSTQYQQYDALGNAQLTIDAANKSWTQTYDAVGNLLSSANPYGQNEAYSYDKAGNLQTHTDTNTAVTQLTSNADGLPLTVTDASDQQTTLEYDGANRLTALIDANGHRRYRSYDDAGRLASQTDGLGNQTRFSYRDERLDSIHYPTFEQQLDYDSRDRINSTTQQADNLNLLRRFGYDPDGNETQAIDANGNPTQRAYDALNRLISLTDADGGLTRFSYDARDNLTEVTDPEGRITQYTYTLRGQLAEEIKAGANPTSRDYQYDSRGNLIQETNPDNEQVQYRYDDANRLTETRLYAQAGEANPIKVVTYHYNDQDQYTGYSQAAGSAGSGQTADIRAHSETYRYNALNQLTDVTVDFGLFQKSYSYTYHPNGLKQSYTNPEGVTYQYHYNANNQLEAVLIPGVGQLAYSDFDWQQPQTLTLPGGNTIRYQYDPLQRQQSRTLYDAADTTLANAITAYDNESNITAIQREHGDYRFNYDNQYRLTGADYPVSSELPDQEAFGYDGVGNRTQHQTTSASYNDQNQLTEQDSGWNYSYNPNGHTTQKSYSGSEPINGPQTIDYVYNREERLIAVRHDSVTVAEYAYDPYGRRIKKTADGNTTYYFYTDQGLSAEYDATGSLIKEYHFMPGGTWGTNPQFQRTADNTIYYYQNDHLGTPQRLIAASGVVVWEARYEAFGKATIIKETISNNLRFPGQYYDGETGLHQNYFRDYDPATGRYIQADPIGLEGGINTYVYVGGGPISWADPYGLKPCPPGMVPNGTPCWINDGDGEGSGYPKEGKCATANCAADLPDIVPPSDCFSRCVIAANSARGSICKYLGHPAAVASCKAAAKAKATYDCAKSCKKDKKNDAVCKDEN